MSFERDRVRDLAARLAAKGVFIGTSSWKYPGWRGMLYDEQRYIWRGRYSETRFQNHCLSEYAEVFKTVCVDAAYYQYPEEKLLAKLTSAVPEDFLFTFKVTDEITIRKFANLPRFGSQAGKPNARYLNAEVFTERFLNPCTSFRNKIGLLVFEFSKFHQTDYVRGRDFVADLDRFLGEIPRGWPYGVEIRNRHFLKPEYFAALQRHAVTHVFNSWTDMPPLPEQLALPNGGTSSRHAAARFLLRPGRRFEEAVRLFQPYTGVKEVNSEARAAGVQLIKQGIAAGPERKTFIYVNNRLEGNALETIGALLDTACGRDRSETGLTE